MAGDWLKMEICLAEKPEVIQMAAALKMDEFDIVGRLHRIWGWADQQSQNGHAMTVTCSFLDRLTRTNGFADALRKAGWLEGRDNALTFPHFDRHNGQTAKNRALANERKEKQRQKIVTEMSRNDRDICHADTVTREEKRREDKRIKKKIPKKKVFKPPSLEEIIAYANERNSDVDPKLWYDYYEAGDWHDTLGNPIKAWKQKFLTAENKGWFRKGTDGSSGSSKPMSFWESNKRIEELQRQLEETNIPCVDETQEKKRISSRAKLKQELKTLKAS